MAITVDIDEFVRNPYQPTYLHVLSLSESCQHTFPITWQLQQYASYDTHANNGGCGSHQARKASRLLYTLIRHLSTVYATNGTSCYKLMPQTEFGLRTDSHMLYNLRQDGRGVIYFHLSNYQYGRSS